MTISRIPDRQATKSRIPYPNLVNPASLVAAKSRIPSRYFAFSRIPHRILVKSRIPRIPFQTLFQFEVSVFKVCVFEISTCGKQLQPLDNSESKSVAEKRSYKNNLVPSISLYRSLRLSEFWKMTFSKSLRFQGLCF